MGIDLYAVTEFNEEQGAVLDPQSVLPALLHRSHERGWRLMQYIDPYGDTIFNQLQMATVLAEFKALGAYAESEEERNWLTNAIQLIERANDVHDYLKLIGD